MYVYTLIEVTGMTQLYRAQVLLERKQHEALQTLAAAEGRSMSEIIREAVAEYLVDQDEEAEARRGMDALDRLVAFREKIEARYGVYEGNLVTESRTEREQEIEQTLKDNE
ncbi:MAG: ribbon-helix-helix protein, CopG family [Anaerolineae bacterium]|nr:ribbon-helix-helix protein, CopG family [Anaerolineae bacterium]